MEDRHRRQQDALFALTGSEIVDAADLVAAFHRITEVTAETLGVARTSLWRYNHDRSAIVCVDLFERAAGRHSAGVELRAVQYPGYFEALAARAVLAADDARADPRTREFAGDYLEPLGITSMMDAPVHIGGRVEGVLCQEHVGPARRWTSDEQTFAVASANVASLALAGWERVKAEAATRLRSAALDAAADAVAITDRDGAIEWVNAAFTVMTGYTLPEALGQNHRELTRSGEQDQERHRKLREAMASGRAWRGEMANRRKDGAEYPVDLAMTPIAGPGGQVSHFVAVERDLTESKRLEAQFLQAQKMELVGRLAGGVAHDFNNLLTVINGTCDLLLMTMSASEEVRADLRQIQEAGRRAAALTRQLLAFGRKQILNAENIDLGAMVSDWRKTLLRLIGEDVTLVVDAPAEVSYVRADPGQIEQALMNLAINARDAMPDGGSLTVRTANVDLDDSRAARLGVPPGPYVAFEVADTGAGMDQETRDRMFEPFFTTKEPGRGTGLGLSTVLNIVEQSSGAVHVESEPGRGTTVSLYLPRIERDARDDDGGELAGVAEPARRETILVVEDEEPLRLLAGRILAAAGYEVLTAGDAAGALEAAAGHTGAIHLLFTDVVLPGINGRKLAEQVAARHPGIVVLFTSGYTEDAILRHGVRDEGTPFISKPYTAARLARTVRSLLDAAARRTPGS